MRSVFFVVFLFFTTFATETTTTQTKQRIHTSSFLFHSFPIMFRNPQNVAQLTRNEIPSIFYCNFALADLLYDDKVLFGVDTCLLRIVENWFG